MYTILVFVICFIGWSNNHFNNLHFRIPLETTYIATCAAAQPLLYCDVLKRRLLK